MHCDLAAAEIVDGGEAAAACELGKPEAWTISFGPACKRALVVPVVLDMSCAVYTAGTAGVEVKPGVRPAGLLRVAGCSSAGPVHMHSLDGSYELEEGYSEEPQGLSFVAALLFARSGARR